ncbi:YbaB/EbfC DNA-binding family protein [Parafrankia irregularis]|uniref:YbaB/EbfC DNA-binding family protein n=1 Tax=Parafrankia irregularis TaxID=795642 RepID=A0A0S4QLR1_9ACTN|nr:MULTISPECIES: YbaB/EbfC family nucleoid-associated protein [Parafrankia]MBE3202277.1 YbaB/EbfC family nucleoid-associated protein [Parafrankia sp. CH37]CUU56046.1 YbaB/EbfC DNA-binding family protein [Parafrankia irregularis]
MGLFDESLLEAARAELARTEEVTARIRREGAAVRHQASDRGKLLTVTASGDGEITAISFRGDGYRDLAPAELADLLVKTIEQARTGARSIALAGLQDLMLDLPSPIGRLGEVDTSEELVEELLGMFTRNMPDSGAAPVADRNGHWS